MGGTVVGIDVGTTKMCTLVGEVDNADQLRIVGVGVVPSRGLRKGVIVSVDEAAAAIAASIQKAERISGYKIENAYVGVAGSHIASLNTRGVVAIGRGDRPIMQEDVDRAMEAAQAVAVPHNRQIIHAIPRGFSLDDQEGVRNPIGLMGYRLEVEAHIVTGAITSLRNLASCVQNAGVGITAMVLQPLASAEAVASEQAEIENARRELAGLREEQAQLREHSERLERDTAALAAKQKDLARLQGQLEGERQGVARQQELLKTQLAQIQSQEAEQAEQVPGRHLAVVLVAGEALADVHAVEQPPDGLAGQRGGAPRAVGERVHPRDVVCALFAEPETARPEFSGSYGFVIHEMSEARDQRVERQPVGDRLPLDDVHGRPLRLPAPVGEA